MKRRQVRFDVFGINTEMTQQIDDNVSVEQVAGVIRQFVDECPHSATRLLFSGSTVTEHHHQGRNMDIALGVYKSVANGRYDSLDDLIEALNKINVAMRSAMKKDILGSNLAFYLLLFGSIASIILGYFVVWWAGVVAVGLTASAFYGIRTYVKRNNQKLINVLVA